MLIKDKAYSVESRKSNFSFKKGYVNDECYNDYILKSWERCKRYGLTRNSSIKANKVTEKKLNDIIEKNKYLIKAAMPYIKNIFSFVKETEFIILLTDVNGIILEILGDNQFIDFISSKFHISKGVIVEEKNFGNTSITTCLISKSPVMFTGNEYFLSDLKGLISSSAPIKRKEKILGTLNMMISDIQKAEYSLALVVAIANAIENKLEIEDVREEILNKSLYQNAIVEYSSDGFLTIDNKGILTYINQTGAEILGIDREKSIGKYVGDLVDFEPVILSVLRTGKGYTDKEFIVGNSRNGIKHHFIKSAIPMRDEEGKIIGVIDNFRKINRVHKMMKNLGFNYAKFTFDDIIGNSSKIKECIRLGEIAARSSSNVLIYGESGTGKEMFAQSIHNASIRKDESFVSINCAAIPSELIESELFGYEGGAFTGALKKGQIGKFEFANGGTIFLDEIGDMPLHMQAKLLRVLQEKQFSRVGGRELIEVDVRIICATNKDLISECRKGNFREDLYYRLNVLNIYLPPLRERIEDLELLVHHFINKISRKINSPVKKISPQAIEMLKRYHWPGNVRQLENVIERAMNISTGKTIGIKEIEISMPDEIEKHLNYDKKDENDSEDTIKTLQEIEKEAIEKVLKITNNNISQAANLLKISRNTIYNKIKKYDIYV